MLTSVLLVAQLMVLASGQLSVTSIRTIPAPTTTPDTTTTDIPTTPPTTTPPPDACGPNTTTAIEENTILIQLNSGQLAIPSIPIVPQCCNEPLNVPHIVEDEYHVPTIHKGSCNGLFCQDPPCLVRKKIRRRKCVLVYKRIYGVWYILGYRFRYYYHHQQCGCKQCEDIKDAWQCISTTSCPNCPLNALLFPNSYCTWDASEGCICTDV